jgi:hypothetical protein
LVYSDVLGGDFVLLQNDANGFSTVFRHNAYPYDTLGTDSTRIYLGLKSTRAEIMKLHKWIDKVQDTLMNLRLLCWQAKGFKEWYVQKPDIHSRYTRLIDDFINPKSALGRNF